MARCTILFLAFALLHLLVVGAVHDFLFRNTVRTRVDDVEFTSEPTPDPVQYVPIGDENGNEEVEPPPPEVLAEQLADEMSWYEVFPNGTRYLYQVTPQDALEALQYRYLEIGSSGSNFTAAADGDASTDHNNHRRFIQGADQRYRANTNVMPFQHSGMLTYSPSWQCTATLVGPKVLLTAAHCIHSGGPGGKAHTDFCFYPRLNSQRTTSTPCIPVTRWFVLKEWVDKSNNLNSDFDMGFLVLARSPGLGHAGFGSRNLPVGQGVYTAGYPATGKPPGTMWVSPGKISAVLPYRYEDKTSDIIGGNSGGAVWEGTGSNSMIRAVVAGEIWDVTPDRRNVNQRNQYMRLTGDRAALLCKTIASWDTPVCR